MNIKVPIKIHNRFDIEVKDVLTNKIDKYKGENIVLNSMFNTANKGVYDNTGMDWASGIAYGSGTGDLIASGTDLFNRKGSKLSSIVEQVQNLPPLTSYTKRKCIIGTSEAIGITISEVGVFCTNASGNWISPLLTHALLQDSAGNQISIGPKTDTQEITIYSTIFAEITLADGMTLLIPPTGLNGLLKWLTGAYMATAFGGWNARYLYIYNDKTPTNSAGSYTSAGSLYSKQDILLPTVKDYNNKSCSTGRIRMESNMSNGRIWSIVLGSSSPSTVGSTLRLLFPCSIWSGYHFEGKNIGTGDGNTTEFVLPWSDINTSKQYDFYVDGAKKTAGTDYTLANAENETSITFANAPGNGLVITGDWWVDYIPKDADHVLDITFTIAFSEGA